MKQILLLLLFIFSILINKVYSQNWEWDIFSNSKTINEINYIYPITKDKWLIEGSSHNFGSIAKRFLSVVDSSGTLYGEVNSSYHIIDILTVNDSILFVAVGFIGENTIKNIWKYEINNGIPNKVGSLFNIQNLIPTTAAKHFFITPNLQISLAEQFEENLEQGAKIHSINPKAEYILWGSTINEIINLGVEKYLVSGNINTPDGNFGIAKLHGNISTGGYIFTQKNLENKVITKILKLPNHQIVAVDFNTIYILDDFYQIINSTNFQTLGNYEDILIDDNSIYLITKRADNKNEIHEFNFQLELIQTTIVEIPGGKIKMTQVKDGIFGIGANVDLIDFYEFPTFVNSMYLKVFKKEEGIKFKDTDIKIEKIRIPYHSITKNEECSEDDMVNLKLNKVKLTIKNEGKKAVNELFVNFIFDKKNPCLSPFFSINRPTSTKFFNLNLQPGTSTVLTLNDIFVNKILPEDLNELNLIPLCFWVSSIDHSVDVDPSDNHACETILLEDELITPIRNLINPFVVFPNPAKERIRVRILDPSKKNAQISISNAIGQQVLFPKEGNSKAFIEFDISHLPHGIYFINFIKEDEIFSEKFIKY